MKKVELNILSKSTHCISEGFPENPPDWMHFKSDKSFAPRKDQGHLTLGSRISPSSNVFQIELTNPQYHLLQVPCSAIIDIAAAKIEFKVQLPKIRSDFKSLLLQCGAVGQVRKSQINPHRLFMQEINVTSYFSMDFFNKKEREDFLYCLYGAKKYSEIVKNIQSDCLSIYIGTWNIGGTKPNESLSQWLKCQGAGTPLLPNVACYVPHDIYVIAFQEDSLDVQLDSVIKTELQLSFKEDFTSICTKSNLFPKTLKLSLFCRSNVEKHFANVNTDAINTGFANTCGNKGAVSISFDYQNASFCLINCHLTSGAEHVKRREDEFRTILQKLHLNKDKYGQADLLQKFDFVFCMGDFNMRIDTHITNALKLLQTQQQDALLQSDELIKYHMVKSQNPFQAFKEPIICHGPTYKYLRGTKNNLDPFKPKIGKADKINAPSWCDRVLYRTRNDKDIHSMSYGIQLDNKISDHKPVFSSFLLALPTKDYLASDSPKSFVTLNIDEILIKINQNYRTKKSFRIFIEGPLLKESCLSRDSCVTVDSSESQVYVVGKSKLKERLKSVDFRNKIAILFLHPFSIIFLKPGLSQRDINTNCLYISVLVSDKRIDTIANAVIQLKRFSISQSHSFEFDLYEHGIIVGEMVVRGAMHYTLRDNAVMHLSETRLIDLFDDSFENEMEPFSCKLIEGSKDVQSKASKPLIKISGFIPIQRDKRKSTQLNFHKRNGIAIADCISFTDMLDTYNDKEDRHGEDISKYFPDTERNSSVSSESDVMIAHSLGFLEERYSSVIIREGISNLKRNLDVQVDLMKLEDDMIGMKSQFKKNVSNTKKSQEGNNVTTKQL